MSNSTPKRVLFASRWWHHEIVNGVIRHAAQKGWHTNLHTILAGTLPQQWDGEGIITQLGVDLGHLRRLIDEAGCPAVSLNNNDPEFEIARVVPDDRAAGQMAAEHLLQRGFKHYAFYSLGQSAYSSKRRYAAFNRTLQQAGFEAEFLTCAAEQGPPEATWQNRQRRLGHKLAVLEKPVGIFCVNDQAAVEVIESCLAESIAIPDQVAVLGMLDMDIFRHSTTVALSSVRIDYDQVTKAACDLLGRMMDGEPAPADPIRFAPVGVSVRQSTDTLAAHSPVVAAAVRFMLDHYQRDIGIDQMINATGGSRAGLFKAFKDDLGRTPGDLLTQIRLDKAKQMLEQTDEKVYTVAEECGFGTTVNLHRAFKRHIGQSPNAWRKKGRES